MQFHAARGFVVAAGLLLATALGAQAGDETAGTLQLRGGYDANPTGAPGSPPGSAFVTTSAAIALGRGDDTGKLAFAGEAERTEYSARDLVPSTRAKLRLEGETHYDGWSLRAGARLDNTESYDLRAQNAIVSGKLTLAGDAFRPFIAGELRYATLNETNILFADFLPEPQRFVRATATPGVAIVHGRIEFGASVALSSTRYIGDSDPLGFDRDNTRIQPFLFASYKSDGFDVTASVSRFNGTWPDRHFGRVQQLLYDLSLGKTFGDFKLDLAASRMVEDTTFPYVPVTLATRMGATLSWRAMPKLTLRASAKELRVDYLGLPLESTTTAIGLGAAYDCGDGWTLGVEAARIRGTLLDGEPMQGGVALVSLAKAFKLAAGEPDEKRWTALPPPIAQDTAPLGGNVSAPPLPHQP
jgi:hypothetical protein